MIIVVILNSRKQIFFENDFDMRAEKIAKQVYYDKKGNYFTSLHHMCIGNHEKYCSRTFSSFFDCFDSSQAINHKFVCDFIEDCENGSDEKFCG